MLTGAQYRAVIVKKKQVKNPEYVQGGTEPYYLYLDETFEEHCGPYLNIGTAKAVITRESGAARPGWLGPNPQFVSGHVEVAETVWKKVDLGA